MALVGIVYVFLTSVVVNNGLCLRNDGAFAESSMYIGMIAALMTVPFFELHPVGTTIAPFGAGPAVSFVVGHLHSHFGLTAVFADQFALRAKRFLKINR